MLNFYLLLFLALASTVDAGAWSRSKGEGFTMTSIDDIYTSDSPQLH